MSIGQRVVGTIRRIGPPEVTQGKLGPTMQSACSAPVWKVPPRRAIKPATADYKLARTPIVK
jgi:hypothetical protein